MDLLRRLFSRRATPALPKVDLVTAAERELVSILDFWQRNSRDPAGGFWAQVWDESGPKSEGLRGALLTSRVLWTFSAAQRLAPSPARLEMAQAAYADLQRFRDTEHGGLMWGIDPREDPRVHPRRIYGQAFGIFGLSEYSRATGVASALEEAVALYRLVEEHARDREHGGYYDALEIDWGAVRDLGKPGPKSQNTMLHLMEAYANLLLAWPDPGLRADLAALIELMLDRVLDPAGQHLRLFFTPDMQVASDRLSPGHDIEFSWLVVDAARAVGDPNLEAKARKAAVNVAAATLPYIEVDGGISYEIGPDGPVEWHRAWWVMAEAAVGFLNAFELSGNAAFRTAAEGCWSYIERHIIDREHGEWFARVHPGGEPNRKVPKIDFWKCTYHNARATMEIAARARRLGL